MNRRHAAVAATAVVSFTAAGGLAYVLGTGHSATATAPSTPAARSTPWAAPATTPAISGDGTVSTGPAQAPGVVGYLNTAGQNVAYLTWQVDTSGSVSGTLDAASVAGTAPDERVVPDTNISVFGQITGTTISLQVNGHTDTGTISDGSLVLNVVQQDGSIAPITFHSATPADYNAALASLRSTVASDDGQAQTSINQAQVINALASAVNSLSTTQSNIQTDLSSVAHDVSSTQNDVGSTHSDMQNVLTEAGNGTDNSTVCGDASSVAGDASSVAGDASSLGGDITSLTTDIQNLRSGIATVQSDLQAVQGQVPGYSGTSNGPSPEQVAQDISAAQSAIGEAVQGANSQIDTENGLVATARGYAVRAAQVGNCPMPDPTPAPIQHIS